MNTHHEDHVFVITTCIIRVFALLLQDREFLDNADLYHNLGFMPKAPGATTVLFVHHSRSLQSTTHPFLRFSTTTSLKFSPSRRSLSGEWLESLHNSKPALQKDRCCCIAGANQLVRNIVNCLNFTQSPVLARSAVACVSAMCLRSDVQQEMMIQGALWLLLPILFWYDVEGTTTSTDTCKYEPYDALDTKRDYDALTELQTKDATAREGAMVLMRFIGWGTGDEVTPLCPLVQDSTLGVLGPGLANLMKGMTESADFLKTINSHNEIPEILWFEKHEEELRALCAKQTDDLAEGVCDHEAGISFNYKVTETELCIHGIYVRILVKRTVTEGFHEDVALPEVFFQRLLQWCCDPASLPVALDHPTRGVHTNVNVELTLQCVMHMLTASGGRIPAVSEVSIPPAIRDIFGMLPGMLNFSGLVTCCGLFFSASPQNGATGKLFEFCAPDKWPEPVHKLTLQVLLKCGDDAKFIQDVIKSPGCLTPLLCSLNGGTAATKKAAMEVLLVLTNNAKVLLETVRRGVVIYLLAIAASPDGINETARAVLQKMSKSALHGLKVTDAMEQFLPKAVVNGIVNQLGEDEFTFTMECKTPELIWSDDMALLFRQAVSGQLESLYDAQLHDSGAKPELDEEYAVDYEVLEDEMFIGGIYVRLFLKNPQYNIRKPEKFIEALFAAHEALACADGMAKDLGYICTCIITVLKIRVLLCDHLANLGIIERLLNWERLTKSHGRKAMLKYMHMLSNSAIACEKFARGGEGVKVLKDLLEEAKERKDVLEVLGKMLNGAKPTVRTEMVMQLEETGYIPALFGYLKDKEEPIPLKVAGVELLKAMASDGDEATATAVTEQLEGTNADHRHCHLLHPLPTLWSCFNRK